MDNVAAAVQATEELAGQKGREGEGEGRGGTGGLGSPSDCVAQRSK